MRFQKTGDLIERFYQLIITFFSIIILTLVCFYNARMTSYLVKWETTYYVQDSVGRNVSVLILSVFFLSVLKKTNLYARIVGFFFDDYNFSRTKRLLLLIIFSIAAIWAFSTQFIPGVDEGEIQSYVHAFSQKNYDMFAPGNYMHRYPNQYGYFLFSCFISIIFGSQNFIVLEMVNSFAIAMIWKQLSETGRFYGLGKPGQIVILLIGVVFFPVQFYSIMIYGNMIGIALALTAVKYVLAFFQDYKRRDAVYCSLFISLAVLMKSNMSIYLIAIIIYALFKLLKERKAISFLLIFLLIIGFGMQSMIPRMVLEHITGYKIENPCSTWSFIAMGLLPGEFAPGWWNSYIHTSYAESNGNTILQAQISKECIKSALAGFLNDRSYALEFFTKKIASTWANPSFQCFATVRNGSLIHIPLWVYLLLSYPGQYLTVKYLNILVFLILSGALTGIVLNYRSKSFSDTLVLPMVFVGGFIFHLFWEAKARYALLYFLVLIPYAVLGINKAVEALSSASLRFTRKSRTGTLPLPASHLLPITLCILSLAAYTFIYSGDRGGILMQDTQQYYEYIQYPDVSKALSGGMKCIINQ